VKSQVCQEAESFKESFEVSSVCEVTQDQKSADDKPNREEDDSCGELKKTLIAKIDSDSQECNFCVRLAETFWAEICGVDMFCRLRMRLIYF
jgi:hypothetical protein